MATTLQLHYGTPCGVLLIICLASLIHIGISHPSSSVKKVKNVQINNGGASAAALQWLKRQQSVFKGSHIGLGLAYGKRRNTETPLNTNSTSSEPQLSKSTVVNIDTLSAGDKGSISNTSSNVNTLNTFETTTSIYNPIKMGASVTELHGLNINNYQIPNTTLTNLHKKTEIEENFDQQIIPVIHPIGSSNSDLNINLLLTDLNSSSTQILMKPKPQPYRLNKPQYIANISTKQFDKRVGTVKEENNFQSITPFPDIDSSETFENKGYDTSVNSWIESLGNLDDVPLLNNNKNINVQDFNRSNNSGKHTEIQERNIGLGDYLYLNQNNSLYDIIKTLKHELSMNHDKTTTDNYRAPVQKLPSIFRLKNHENKNNMPSKISLKHYLTSSIPPLFYEPSKGTINNNSYRVLASKIEDLRTHRDSLTTPSNWRPTVRSQPAKSSSYSSQSTYPKVWPQHRSPLKGISRIAAEVPDHLIASEGDPWWVTHDPYKNSPSPPEDHTVEFITPEDMKWIRENIGIIGELFSNQQTQTTSIDIDLNPDVDNNHDKSTSIINTKITKSNDQNTSPSKLSQVLIPQIYKPSTFPQRQYIRNSNLQNSKLADSDQPLKQSQIYNMPRQQQNYQQLPINQDLHKGLSSISGIPPNPSFYKYLYPNYDQNKASKVMYPGFERTDNNSDYYDQLLANYQGLPILFYPDYTDGVENSSLIGLSSWTGYPESNMEQQYPGLALGQGQTQNQSQSVVNTVHSYQNLIIQLSNGTNITAIHVSSQSGDSENGSKDGTETGINSSGTNGNGLNGSGNEENQLDMNGGKGTGNVPTGINTGTGIGQSGLGMAEGLGTGQTSTNGDNFGIGSNAGSNTGSNTGINTGSNTGSNAGSQTGLNTGSNIGFNTGINTGSNTASNTESMSNSVLNSGFRPEFGARPLRPGIGSGISSNTGGTGQNSGNGFGGANVGSTGPQTGTGSCSEQPKDFIDDLTPTVYNCNSAGSKRYSNFMNPSYPYFDVNTGICMFRLHLLPRVCQVRIDVVETNFAPPSEGVCVKQYLTIQGTIWRPGVQRLCGTNNNNHFYLEVDDESKSPYIEVVVSILSTQTYRWGMWITQISCDQPSTIRAPDGCFQYFPNLNGEIKSFSFEDNQYYNDQHYRMCIGTKSDICSVTFSAKDGDFMLEKYGSIDEVPFDRSGMSSLYCVRDYLRILDGSPDGGQHSSSHDRYCGGHLSSTHGAAAPSPVTSRVTSRVVVIEFHAGIPMRFDSRAHGPGFRVSYQQNICPEDSLVSASTGFFIPEPKSTQHLVQPAFMKNFEQNPQLRASSGNSDSSSIFKFNGTENSDGSLLLRRPIHHFKFSRRHDAEVSQESSVLKENASKIIDKATTHLPITTKRTRLSSIIKRSSVIPSITPQPQPQSYPLKTGFNPPRLGVSPPSWVLQQSRLSQRTSSNINDKSYSSPKPTWNLAGPISHPQDLINLRPDGFMGLKRNRHFR